MASPSLLDTYFIYGLTYPLEPEIVRYVGLTKNFLLRYKAHASGQLWCFVGYWCRGLRVLGRTPNIHLLRIVHGTLTKGRKTESILIRQYEQKSGRLLNYSPFVSRARACGLTRRCWEAYLESLRTVYELLNSPNRNCRALTFAVRVIHHLESAFPVLRLFTQSDSFACVVRGECRQEIEFA